MDKGFRQIKGYQADGQLRKSFSELSKKVFGLEFEDWYQEGCWGGNYIPYSICSGTRVIANASVNPMEFHWNGTPRTYIQIGTVMTAPDFRRQGLGTHLIREILRHYRHRADGMFLFANDGAIDFYPRFGFKKSREFQYSRQVRQNGGVKAVQVPMETKQHRSLLKAAVLGSADNSPFEMSRNVGLVMFYVIKFMRHQVYYIEDQAAYVIAEQEKGSLVIHGVFSPKQADLDGIIGAFGLDITEVTLGFKPWNADGFEARELKEEDLTLLTLGEDWEMFEIEKNRFPALSHA